MRQIIAIGGGGFGRNSDANHIEQYILDQSKKSRPNILFIPTASAEPPEYIDNFYKVFKRLNCVPSMLAVWKEWNIDKLLKREYKKKKLCLG